MSTLLQVRTQPSFLQFTALSLSLSQSTSMAFSSPTAKSPLLLFPFLYLLLLSLDTGASASSLNQKVHAPTPTPALAPAQDCTAYLIDMFDCLEFVEEGSKATKPKKTCCAGLKKVERENEMCLCDSLANSKDYGIKLNMSRAVALPSACGVSAPSPTKCKSMLVSCFFFVFCLFW